MYMGELYNIHGWKKRKIDYLGKNSNRVGHFLSKK